MKAFPDSTKCSSRTACLRGYMQDTLNARLMGVSSTGSGRRQSFRFPPQPRMCNTYMPNGKSTRRRDRRLDQTRHLREIVCRRSSRDRQGRLRLHGRRRLPGRKRQDHRAGAQRFHRRQWARCNDESGRGRQRQQLRTPALYVRERRPIRPRRRGHADRQDFVDHRRRYAGMNEAAALDLAKTALDRARSGRRAERRSIGFDRATVSCGSARERALQTRRFHRAQPLHASVSRWPQGDALDVGPQPRRHRDGGAARGGAGRTRGGRRVRRASGASRDGRRPPRTFRRRHCQARRCRESGRRNASRALDPRSGRTRRELQRFELYRCGRRFRNRQQQRICRCLFVDARRPFDRSSGTR